MDGELVPGRGPQAPAGFHRTNRASRIGSCRRTAAAESGVLCPAYANYNDPALTEGMAAALRRRLGEAKVVEVPSKMVSEDFSEYGRAGVPSVMFFVGAVDPTKYKEAKASGTPLPSLHSSKFCPDLRPTIETAMATETTILMELMGKPSGR
ncbi:MAG TPA: hypothetical protein VKE24_08350 [Candidatus Acidoferrales bacterium]|nr:hypothetical protein [Candidatus Acidoferrales bacterium]